MVAKAVQLLDKLSDSPEVRHWVERAEEAQKFHQIDLRLAKAEGIAIGEVKGKAEGKAEGKAKAILNILDARGIEVSEQVRARVMECTTLERLQQWLVRAVSVKRAEDLFDSTL